MRIVLVFLLFSVFYLTANLSSQTADMILIPAGEFQMGSDTGERDEKPVRTVYLDAFYIDKHEVTVGEYKRFVEVTGHRPLPESVGRTSPTDEHPVVEVSWYDAMAYAKWADKRLPTEAEWEKAARGGLIAQAYPWGDAIDANSANYNKNTKSGRHDERTTPVGTYPANGYGLHDMSGNVAEWCLDTYHRKFYAHAPRNNPIAGAENVQQAITNASANKKKRVARGGSWSFNAKSVRVANRLAEKPSLLSSDVGFRCAKVVGTHRVPSTK